jgi:hypothetical protein
MQHALKKYGEENKKPELVFTRSADMELNTV